jgi:hypothetical protein
VRQAINSDRKGPNVTSMAILNLVIAIVGVSVVTFVMYLGHRAAGGHLDRRVLNDTPRLAEPQELDRAA